MKAVGLAVFSPPQSLSLPGVIAQTPSGSATRPTPFSSLTCQMSLINVVISPSQKSLLRASSASI